MRKAVFVALLMMAACGPKVVPLPAISLPRFPDFIAPVVPTEYANSAAASYQTSGWTFLQAGDLKTAEREFSTALKATSAFYPAEISLGWVELARRDQKAALAHFDRALERQAADLRRSSGAVRPIWRSTVRPTRSLRSKPRSPPIRR
jgi:tetratricopeptide (TPR) repeat protein